MGLNICMTNIKVMWTQKLFHLLNTSSIIQ